MDMYVGHGNHTIAGRRDLQGSSDLLQPRKFFGDAVRRGVLGANRRRDDRDRTRRPGWPRHVPAVHQPRRHPGANDISGRRAQEVRIYPVDLGVDKSKRPWSKMSIPMTPSPELANRILADVQKYSEPFGTKISIENGVGVIRVPASATVPIGGDMRSTFRLEWGVAAAAADSGSRSRWRRANAAACEIDERWPALMKSSTESSDARDSAGRVLAAVVSERRC